MSSQKNDLRKVLINEQRDGSGSFTIKGLFHRWGDLIHRSENTVINKTLAIVELEDGGKINNYPPQMVKFES